MEVTKEEVGGLSPGSRSPSGQSVSLNDGESPVHEQDDASKPKLHKRRQSALQRLKDEQQSANSKNPDETAIHAENDEELDKAKKRLLKKNKSMKEEKARKEAKF